MAHGRNFPVSCRAGMDLIYGHRTDWMEWGGPVFGTFDGKGQKDYFAASAYAFVADRVPFVGSDRHQVMASIYGGVGSNLDRFSAFRLPGRPTGWEWESISSPIFPGATFMEFFPRSYGIVNLVYRYEPVFFVQPYVRGTWAWVDRPRFKSNGQVGYRMDSLPALGAGLIAGAPWNSQIELNYAYNFGVLRDSGHGPEYGGHSMFLLWEKEF
jgi:hypothetical protein